MADPVPLVDYDRSLEGKRLQYLIGADPSQWPLVEVDVPMTDWRTARCLDTLRDQVNAAYPGRDKSSDGTIGDAAHAATHSEHNPDANGVVRAEDITNDPAHGCSSEALAQALVASRDSRILYVISNRKIANSTIGWAWRPYTGSNPHDQHMHLSVVADPALYDDTRPWQISGATPIKPPAGSVTRFTGITATVFADDSVAYTDVAPGWNNRYGVALPYLFSGKRPQVRVFANGRSAVGDIIDQGPWNYTSKPQGLPGDPYWQTGSRPQAESGTDMTGRRTNLAGIDLTLPMAAALGIDGKGLVDWEFVTDDPVVILPPHPPTPGGTMSVDQAMAKIRPILEGLAVSQPPDKETIRKYLLEVLGNKPGAPVLLAPPAPTVAPEPTAPVAPPNPSGTRTDIAIGTLAGGGVLGAWLTGLLSDPQALGAAVTAIVAAVKGRDWLKAAGLLIQAGAAKIAPPPPNPPAT